MHRSSQRLFSLLAGITLMLGGGSALFLVTAEGSQVEVWRSSEAPSIFLRAETPLTWGRIEEVQEAKLIEVNPRRSFQRMLGMGASLESTTCSNLSRMAVPDRVRAMRQLMDRDAGLGMNLMRVCIGSSDFTGDPWYSYDDLAPGETDLELNQFSIGKDRHYILPIIQLAKEMNPQVLFFASPWSPPGWMKTTGTMIGGELLPQYYPVYARYLVRFLKAYAAEGIPMHALTVQNEPGVDRARSKDPKWHYPSCHWTASQEAEFIGRHLGPALRQAGLKTRIWCYDHNYNLTPTAEEDGISHPMTILADRRAARFVGGVAFHGYVGEASGMSRVHEAFPHVPIHFTEGSVFSIYGARDLIDRFRNWASSYNAWVIMLDENGQPNNGPFPAKHAILGLNSITLQATPAFEYFNYAHFMKFVQRGALRVESSSGEPDLNNVAFQNPNGTVITIVANTGTEPRRFVLRCRGVQTTGSVEPKSVITLSWKGTRVGR